MVPAMYDRTVRKANMEAFQSCTQALRGGLDTYPHALTSLDPVARGLLKRKQFCITPTGHVMRDGWHGAAHVACCAAFAPDHLDLISGEQDDQTSSFSF